MKLTGPVPRVRFIVGLEKLTPVVGGMFPPESASEWRAAVGIAAKKAQPAVRREIERVQRLLEHELIYGRPGAREPRGVLQA